MSPAGDINGDGIEVFKRTCFNYPTLGDLYKYAAHDAILQRHEQGVVRNDRTAAV